MLAVLKILLAVALVGVGLPSEAQTCTEGIYSGPEAFTRSSTPVSSDSHWGIYDSAQELAADVLLAARGTAGLLPAGRTGRVPGPTVDPHTGQPVGRFIVDSKGNTLIEPAGGATVGNSAGTFVETRFPNGSPAQQLHGPHRHYPQSHGHGFKPGPGVNERGSSLDPFGNEVPYDSPAAHWPVNL